MIASDTIFALASGAGRAGVAIIRISGKNARFVAMELGADALPLRRAVLRTLKAPTGEQTIDTGIVLRFDGPASFTGEDVVELQLHGSVAVIDAVCMALIEAGARPAGPGEFTRRALYHDKLSLLDVEALGDLLNAETRAQLDLAQQAMSGALGACAESWRQRVLDIAAPLEAGIDFPDEEDIPLDILTKAYTGMKALEGDMETLLHSYNAARRVREGVRAVIFGPPNVGKSTLLNWLAGSDVAIVTDRAGTTRDSLDVRLDIGGQLVTLTDTAGLREEATDPAEIIGIQRARDKVAQADLRIGVVSPDTPLAHVQQIQAQLRVEDIFVVQKSDLIASKDPPHHFLTDGAETIQMSAKKKTGRQTFFDCLTVRISNLCTLSTQLTLTRERQYNAILAAQKALIRAQQAGAGTPELAAEDVRAATRALAEFTGHVDVEDVLTEIFADFCIGK